MTTFSNTQSTTMACSRGEFVHCQFKIRSDLNTLIQVVSCRCLTMPILVPKDTYMTNNYLLYMQSTLLLGSRPFPAFAAFSPTVELVSHSSFPSIVVSA